jgi:hypothetical protein
MFLEMFHIAGDLPRGALVDVKPPGNLAGRATSLGPLARVVLLNNSHCANKRGNRVKWK